jgi:hypothetical protein
MSTKRFQHNVLISEENIKRHPSVPDLLADTLHMMLKEVAAKVETGQEIQWSSLEVRMKLDPDKYRVPFRIWTSVDVHEIEGQE